MTNTFIFAILVVLLEKYKISKKGAILINIIAILEILKIISNFLG